MTAIETMQESFRMKNKTQLVPIVALTLLFLIRSTLVATGDIYHPSNSEVIWNVCDMICFVLSSVAAILTLTQGKEKMSSWEVICNNKFSLLAAITCLLLLPSLEMDALTISSYAYLLGSHYDKLFSEKCVSP